MLLEQLGKNRDIHDMTAKEYRKLAHEIRQFLLQSVSKTGGHLASNLGAVELTIALHAAFRFPKDKVIWDVGHQAYTHKILSGRMDRFDTLRQFGGLSGFPKREESEYDSFDTGHSTTSISAGLGMARARDLMGDDYSVIAVIGDGSMTGGMAFEAMNNAASLNSNFIIVLNDNNMSISENVGGFSSYLSHIRTAEHYNNLKTEVVNTLNKIPVIGDNLVQTISKTKSSIKQLLIPGMLFEDFGITYLGPFDGHNTTNLIRAFQEASKVKGPVLVHVNTKKGMGYHPAEANPSDFHGVGAFDVATGKLPVNDKPSYTSVFSKVICDLAREHEDIVALTAAMPIGTGLNEFAKEFPERFFDTGIAEQHMVTTAAGMAANGLRPVVCVYSSFLQRGYDQLVHDVCMQNLPVIFAIDRGGLVGNDGETHQGLYDLSYLSHIPNMTVIAPASGEELEAAFAYAYSCSGPVAIRYPRGNACMENQKTVPFQTGHSVLRREGSDAALLAEGPFVVIAERTAELLEQKGVSAKVVNMRFIKPVDTALLESMRTEIPLVVTMEDNTIYGGLSEKVNAYYAPFSKRPVVMNAAFPDVFIPHGSVGELIKAYHMDPASLADRILEQLKRIENEE